MEGSNTRILDFVQVLDCLGLIDQQVGTGGIGTETPDLSCIGDVPAVLVGKMSCPSLGVVTWVDFATLDFDGEFLRQGLCLHEETVVLVGRLGESDHTGFRGDSFSVRDDRVGLL